jgi:hypothetical protein
MDTENSGVPLRIAQAINAGRLKHLEMIQAVISRMANNSFLIKGWSLTLLAAILAITVKDRVFAMATVALVPVVAFWLLDAFFLGQERLFRELWDAVSNEPQDSPTNFRMATNALTMKRWLSAISASTLMIFHGCLLIVVSLITLAIRCSWI